MVTISSIVGRSPPFFEGLAHNVTGRGRRHILLPVCQILLLFPAVAGIPLTDLTYSLVWVVRSSSPFHSSFIRFILLLILLFRRSCCYYTVRGRSTY